MTRTLGLVVLGAVGLIALGAADAASAKDYEPSLLVSPAKYTLGARTGVGIGLQQGECCFAPGRVTIYAPPGYSVKLEHPAGTRMGSLLGALRVGNDEVNAVGELTAESPLNHVNNSCAPGTHEAVWMMEIHGGPYRFRVPMYVDRVTTEPEAAYASARLILCLASPYVPPPHGAAAGIALGDAAFGLFDVFTNPTTPGPHPWNVVSVPYAPGTASLSDSLAAQSTSYVRLPIAFSLTVKRLRPGTKTFVVTACVRDNGRALRGVRIHILGRPTARAGFTIALRGRTDSSGCLTRRFRPKSKIILGHALAEVSSRAAAGCSHALVARCSRPTIGPAYPQRTFRVRR